MNLSDFAPLLIQMKRQQDKKMLFEENLIDEHFAEYDRRTGEIRLSGRQFNKPVLLHKDSAGLSKWQSLSELTPDNLLSDVKADDYPEILIIGTGAVQKFIHPKIMADFSCLLYMLGKLGVFFCLNLQNLLFFQYVLIFYITVDDSIK